MTNKTILIVGRAGPQGKSYLRERLEKDDYTVTETEDIYQGIFSFRTSRYPTPCEQAIHNGFTNGFITINFGDKLLTKRDRNYEMPREQYDAIINKIESGVRSIDIAVE